MNITLLIQLAYRFAQVLAETEVVDAEQLSIALTLLNIVIDDINIDGIEIPLVSEETIAMTTGSEEVILADWITINRAQFLLGNVYFDVDLLDLESFLNVRRINNNTGIPYVSFSRRTEGGITLLVYFRPSIDYTMTVWGYKNITTVDLTTDLTAIDKFVQNYLIFMLANDIRRYHQMSEDTWLTKRIKRYKKKFANVKDRPINMIKASLGKRGTVDNLVSLNLGRGYYP